MNLTDALFNREGPIIKQDETYGMFQVADHRGQWTAQPSVSLPVVEAVAITSTNDWLSACCEVQSPVAGIWMAALQKGYLSPPLLTVK